MRHTPIVTVRVESGGEAADAVAALYQISVAELEARDARQNHHGRWIARDAGQVIGVATAFERADDRVFVVHRLTAEAAFAPLLEAAGESLTCALYLSVAQSQTGRIEAANEAGYTIDFTSMAFDVPLVAAQEAVGRLRRPTACDIVAADSVIREELYQLDLELRRDVPGNDGWRGDRHVFDDEMASSDFDPSGYVVARDASGSLCGLCRIWRNATGPALGMLGVTRPHRSGTLAVALLHAALAGAARWGAPSFRTHTARPALQRRLRRLGAVESDGFVRLRRA